MPHDVSDRERLPPGLDENLRQANPWWAGRPQPVLPQYRRWPFGIALRKLLAGLAPIIVVRGPRQVGKTTLQRQIIGHLLAEGAVRGTRILRVQFDDLPSFRGLADPVLAIARWFENRVLGATFNETAHRNEPAFLFLDEVQNVKDWAPQLKAMVDHNTVKVMVTGSSALRIEAGRDSLAGRIAPVEMGTLLLREIAEMRFGQTAAPLLPDNGLESLLDQSFWRGVQQQGLARRRPRDQAFAAFSERGGYPMAQANADRPWPEVADQLNETVIQRAIQHDLRAGQAGIRRDPRLLEEVFRLACRYAGQAPGQAVYVQELRQGLGGDIGWQRVHQYLRFLESALLIKLVQPMEMRLKRRRGSPKVCLCDHGLRASWLQEVVPLTPEALSAAEHLSDLAGHLAESVAGSYLAGLSHLDIGHFPQRGMEPEVDFVLTVGDRRIPLEVKYRRRIDPFRDTLGLRAFVEKTAYNAPFGVLVTMTDDVSIPDPRLVAVSLPSLLMMR